MLRGLDPSVRFERQRLLSESTRLVEIAYAPKWRFPEHEHPRWCVTLVLRGSFRDFHGGRWTEVTPGAVVSYSDGSLHKGIISSVGAKVFQLEVTPNNTCERRIESATLGMGLAPGLAHEVYFEFRFGNPDDDLVLSSLAYELAAAVHVVPPVRHEESPVWLDRVLEILRANVARRIGLDELANEAALHPCHLAREFRRRIGTSVGDYHRRLRLALAAQKLAKTEMSIADVALDSGYADQSHMGRQFRRFLGTTPSRFRETILSQGSTTSSSWDDYRCDPFVNLRRE